MHGGPHVHLRPPPMSYPLSQSVSNLVLGKGNNYVKLSHIIPTLIMISSYKIATIVGRWSYINQASLDICSLTFESIIALILQISHIY